MRVIILVSFQVIDHSDVLAVSLRKVRWELVMDKVDKNAVGENRTAFFYGCYCAEASQTLPEAVPSFGGLNTSTAMT